MQEPVDRERIEIARVGLFLFTEDAWRKTNRSKREGFKRSRGVPDTFCSHRMNGR